MDERQEDMNQVEFETFKNLIMLQMERIEKAESLEEAKEINRETMKAINPEQ